MCFGKRFQTVEQGVVLKTIFGHIGHKHGGLGGDQEKLFEQRQFFFAEIDGANWFGVVQRGLALFQNRHQFDRLFVAGTRGFGHPLQGFLNRGQIGQTQFGLNHFNVSNWVDLAGHVNHIGVFKTTHHIDGGIGFANVCQKFIAQTFTRAGTCHQTGDVDKLHNRRHHALWRDDVGELLQARVRHFHHPHIGLDGAKGVILSRNARFGQRVEQGGFAYIGQAHDAAFQTHTKILGNCVNCNDGLSRTFEGPHDR